MSNAELKKQIANLEKALAEEKAKNAVKSAKPLGAMGAIVLVLAEEPTLDRDAAVVKAAAMLTEKTGKAYATDKGSTLAVRFGAVQAAIAAGMVLPPKAVEKPAEETQTGTE